MAVVYLAHDLALDRKVAIKVMFFAVCPEARPRFAHTDFRRQHNLLRHALSLLLLFPNKPDPEARSLLRRVAERPERSGDRPVALCTVC